MMFGSWIPDSRFKIQDQDYRFYIPDLTFEIPRFGFKIPDAIVFLVFEIPDALMFKIQHQLSPNSRLASVGCLNLES